MANTHITLLGFSQGAATASRWLVESSLKVDRLLLWAGMFPPDLDHAKAHEKLAKSENYLVVGSKDPYVNASSMEQHHKICTALGIYPQVKQFEGGHEINQDLLKEFL